MNDFLSKNIYKFGSYFYNSKLKENYELLKRSEKWSLDELKNFQEKQFLELFKVASNYSNFYKRLFARHNILESDIKSIDDLKKLPIVTKDDLIQFNADVHTNIKLKNKKAKTSGSTGKSLNFYRDKNWDARNRASIQRGLSWYGVEPWERNGYLWGYNFSKLEIIKTQFLDFLQNRFRLFQLKDDKIDIFLNKLKEASYLSGYSSVIFELAKKIEENEKNSSFNNLKVVKGTAEKIFESYQEKVKRVFGHRMISEYGSAESGIISFECPYGHQHIFMENVIVETDIDNEIIITNLVSLSFPIIRYKLGDYVEIDRFFSHCECGMKHPIIKNIFGRIGSKIIGNKEVFPSLTLYYIFKNISAKGILLNYQVIQNKKGKLIINIEQEITDKIKKSILKECYKYFSDDIAVEVIDLYNIKSDKKKQVNFISNID